MRDKEKTFSLTETTLLSKAMPLALVLIAVDFFGMFLVCVEAFRLDGAGLFLVVIVTKLIIYGMGYELFRKIELWKLSFFGQFLLMATLVQIAVYFLSATIADLNIAIMLNLETGIFAFDLEFVRHSQLSLIKSSGVVFVFTSLNFVFWGLLPLSTRINFLSGTGFKALFILPVTSIIIVTFTDQLSWGDKLTINLVYMTIFTWIWLIRGRLLKNSDSAPEDFIWFGYRKGATGLRTNES